MPSLTRLTHGSIRLDQKDPRRVDSAEIRAARSDGGVEVAPGCFRDVVAALAGPGIRIDDDDLPAGELDGPCVDAGEAELEYPSGPVPEQLEDSRGRGGGQCGREPGHRYARYMTRDRTGKFLGVPYDWRRPTWARYKSRWWNTKDRRIVMPRAWGWGYDFNVAEVARRLHLRR
jgi:hypothetical protein